MKRIFYITFFFFLSAGIFAQSEISKISSMPGSFSRSGFAARGMGMGNAMSSVTHGNVVAYYHPALGVFQENNSFQTSYSFLSLDRKLNFLSFTKKFEFEDTSRAAGFSAGIINAGVDNIEERDNQGIKSGTISTSENLIFLGLSNKFSDKFAFGVGVRFYYYSLYEDISSSAIGFDIGAIYSFTDNLNISAKLSDINSAYEWDTTELYGQDGRNTTENFPLLKTVGVSYRLLQNKLQLAVEFESSNAETNYLRFGGEYNIYEELYVRAGVDRLNLTNFDMPVRPSAGFSYVYILDWVDLGFDYAYVFEPYAPSDKHILGLNFKF